MKALFLYFGIIEVLVFEGLKSTQGKIHFQKNKL